MKRRWDEILILSVEELLNYLVSWITLRGKYSTLHIRKDRTVDWQEVEQDTYKDVMYVCRVAAPRIRWYNTVLASGEQR